jgi:SNF2 family DNA or RNA helicase
MTTMMDILQGYLYHMGIGCARLDGSTSGEDRERQLAAFNNPLDESFSVFLLSTRAGGVGINLQAADTVIL